MEAGLLSLLPPFNKCSKGSLLSATVVGAEVAAAAAAAAAADELFEEFV